MRIETTYYIKCTICKKEIKIKEKIGNYEEENFICKECIKTLPEPQRKDCNDFVDYIHKIGNWRNKTEKIASYDYNNFEKDLLEDFGVKGEKAELCFVKAWERGHAYGYPEVINEFVDLLDLIK